MPEDPTDEYQERQLADDKTTTPEERRESVRRRARNTALTLLVLVMAIIVVDFYIARGPGTREFIANNIACLRCHTECLEEMRMSDVHQPFGKELCTSCHTPHGRRVTAKSTDGEFGFQWFRRWLDRLYLNIVWRVFTEDWLVKERPKAPATSEQRTEKGPVSKLVLPLDQLCWTCHGDLGPQRRMEYQHEPFGKSQCVSCHNPHASNNDVVLRLPEEKLCPSCHPIGDELADRQVHQPFEQIQCTSCHQPHASKWRGVLQAKQRDLCFSCHPSIAGLTAKPVQHEAFEHGECTDCHKPHSAQVIPLLIDKKPDLCYNCHPTIRSDFTRVSRHPVNRIGCDCHLPHASDYDGVLINGQPRLCFDCHSEIEDLNKILFKHEPFAEDPCTVCHVPHGSDDAPLLQDADPPLCFNCHPRIENEFRLPSRHPVGTKLKCADCHDPHASWVQPLLVAQGKDLCYRCHSRISTTYEVSLHQPYECTECHKWHASQYSPILQQPNPEVCIKCHTGYASRPHYHVTRPTYWDRNAKRPLTCSSSCHNPHGTNNYHMLRVPYGQRGFGTDYVCRLCHADIGVWY